MNHPITKCLLSLGLAFTLSWLTGQATFAQSGEQQTLPQAEALTPPPEWARVSLLTYAQVLTGGVPVYADPSHPSLGIAPVRALDAGYVWVTVPSAQPIEYQNEAWYPINPGEYVQAGYLAVFQPSTFRGVTSLPSDRFAWIVFDTWTAAEPGIKPGAKSQLLKRYDLVNILDEQLVNDRFWYKIAKGHWIEQGMVGIVTPKPRPQGVGPQEKWIEIDLYEQTLAAYEGDEIVYATLVSSGLPWWRTEPGLFRVWVKIRQAKMSGREGYADYYFLEDVPWTLYFNNEFALHGAYWHDRFGIKHSHGCVNLSLADSKWLYEWATPVGKSGWILATEENEGTWVWVHE